MSLTDTLETARLKINEIHGIAEEIAILAQKAKNYSKDMDAGLITLTDEQKQNFLSKYQEKKNQLKSIINELP